MNKFITYSVGIGIALLFIVAGIGVYFYTKTVPAPQPIVDDVRPQPQPSPTGDVPLPSEGAIPDPTPTPAADPISVKAADEGTVQVNDFKQFEGTTEDPNNNGQYYLANTYEETTLPYSILYVEADQSFTIGLSSEPLGEARIQAEQNLMKVLGIPPVEMCRLQYAVLVPGWVNSIYAGKNLGFSFCTGATQLP